MKKIYQLKLMKLSGAFFKNASGIQKMIAILVMANFFFPFAGIAYGNIDPGSNDLAVKAGAVIQNSAINNQIADLQQGRITGTVTDEEGNPMPGVNIQVEGTTIGSISDIDGKYSINTSAENAVLVFSFIGYNTQSVNAAGRAIIDVKLISSVSALDEVIVIGYGTQKKSDLTGSVVRITMEDKATMSNINVSQALVGATAGVNLEGRGGAEAEPTLSVRGQTSLSASDRPLIVVDGIIYNGSINNINISDVESIDILKDASAAAVYGSRSANGVLLITTKKGKSKKPVISFDMYKGWQDMTNNPMRVMNAEEFAVRLLDWEHQEDVYAWYKTNPTSAAGRPPRPDVTNRQTVSSYLRTYEEQQNYLAGNEIDWVKEVLQIAPMQNYNLGLQGSAENVSYYLSASYSDVEGIQLNDEFQRITLRSNLESQVNQYITLGFNTSYTYRDNSGTAVSLYNARVASPLVDNRIGRPDYEIYLSGELFQPYPLVNLFIDNSDISNELFTVGTAKVEIPWIQGLKYEFNYSHTYSTRNNNTYNDRNTPSGVSNRGLAVKNPSEGRDWLINNILTYSRAFGDHSVNSTFLFSREGRTGNSSTLNAQGFDNETLGYNNMGLGEISTVGSTAYEENSLSYMARLNYSYKSRYMVTGTIRRDGFSGFGAGNKWATFPSASLAWVATQEPFLKDLGFYLKLRTSYGKNGNQGIGRYSSISRMGTRYYAYGSASAIGIYPSTLANADLGWETTTSYNAGFDFGVLENRITGSVDAYIAETTDVLVQRQLPRSSGYTSVWTNIGGIDNKGIEFELTSINYDKGNLRWESNFVFSLNRDKISKLYGGDSDQDIGNSWFVGKSISAIYDYQMAGGVWTEEEFFSGNILPGWYPGQFRYVDQNGDKAIDPTNDRTIVGYGTPSYRFSINNNVSWKDFTLSVFINSIQGGDKYYLGNNAEMINPLFYMQQRMNNSAINAYWRPDAPTTNTTGMYNVPLRQSGIYQSRSFVRLQDVSLTYRLPKKILDKINVQSAQIYVSSKNPYVWTKWQGWDPEIGVSDTPLMRNVITGIRVSF
jgi:TonB-linked SusC/RagA family outer membrane protein